MLALDTAATDGLGHPQPLAVALAASVTAPLAARAHINPAGCFQTGVSINIETFRSNGTTGIVGTIRDCEQIFYRTTLAHIDSAAVCAFSGGTCSLTTPDGVVHQISANVPCLGGTTGEGCVAGVDSLQSGLISYTASPADVSGSGFVLATVNYTGGTAHDTVANTPGVAASNQKSTPVVACTVSTTSVAPTSSTTTTRPPSVCASVKLVTASKLSLALVKCEAKAIKGGVAVVQQCRDKATTKFVTKWTTVETKADCLTIGDLPSIESLIDACTTNLASSLVPPYNP